MPSETQAMSRWLTSPAVDHRDRRLTDGEIDAFVHRQGRSGGEIVGTVSKQGPVAGEPGPDFSFVEQATLGSDC